MYIRIKKIKGIEYAYLVKSYWSKRKKTPKQKTIKYLGRVHKFKRTKDYSIEKYLKIKDIEKYFNKTPIKILIKNIIKSELYNHSFKEEKKDILKQNNVVVDFKNRRVYNSLNNKSICIEINNNFISTKTLRNVINHIIPPGLTNQQIYKYLANSFLSTGIDIPEERFIIISQRILNKITKK